MLPKSEHAARKEPKVDKVRARHVRADSLRGMRAPDGSIYGVEGLTVCDASLFPCVPRANTNIPTIMCAEKVADGLVG